MKLRHGLAISLSGALWFCIGFLLLMKGFYLVLQGSGEPSFLLSGMISLGGDKEQGSLLLIIGGLLVGFFKGRVVLGKTAGRVIARIATLPNPCALTSIYSRSYVLLLSSMVLLGMSFKWIPMPYDLKGFIDVAIGSALVNGSAFYFRHLIEKKANHL